MCDETPQERQDNEIEALKAIFSEQIEDKRAAIAWKVWRPLDLLLTLHPLHSSSAPGVHCSITLHIKCCEEYPNKPPKISIHKLHGLSNENGAKLIKELEELTKQLCGEVMIFELAQHVQSFLHTFNKPTVSFYEEMLERHNELERLKQHDLQVKENEERLKMKSEIQRRQEILKAAPRRGHRASISQEDSSCPENRGDAPNLVLYYSDHKVSATKKSQSSRQSLPCNCTCKGIQILRLTQKNNKKIHIGKCIDHSSNGSTTYLSIDADNGDCLITKKWSLTPATDFQTRNKKINAIEQDLKSIFKLKSQTLIPYTALEIQQEMLKRTTMQCVYLVREFVLGSSLKFLRTKIGVGDNFDALRLLRHVALGVFSALNELHSVEVLHRDVTCENVYLDSDGKVKLVGAALDVRLIEIMESESYCDRQTKGQDILAAACMLLTIISPKNQPNEIPSHLPSTARDFFSRCLTEDEHLQWSAEQLLNHCFLLDAPSVNPESKQQDDGYSGSEDEERELARSFVSHSLPTSGHSRLSAEFEVLKWLGKGAFGDVLKVKNKLDGGFYALKRIKLNPENVNLNKKITREVKLLSRLNHENVVRYYNAWIETIEGNNVEESGSSEISVVENNVVSRTRPAKTLPPNSMEALAAKLAPGVKLEWSISESPVVKKNNNSDSESSEEDDDEDDGWFKRLPTTTALDDETSSSIEFECENRNGSQSQTQPSDETDSPRRENERIQQVLYIQMEFCEKSTLRQAIDNGLFKESFRAWRLFREIVNGLNHVHQRGMIHRDLKPVNIFLDSNDHVKIGDFGLATRAFGAPQFMEDKAKAPEEFGGSLTGQVGTALYVAPELLQAGNKVIYNQKVDIYSLGIILFEMFHPPLDTAMERMKVLTELRSKDVVMPDAFTTEDNVKQIHLIRWLLSHEASSRPTCTELLTSEHVPRPVQEGALSALISHTLTAKPNRSYQLLVNACMEQRISPAEDYTYHSGLRSKPDAVVGALKEILIEVFKCHGATEFSPPLLIPRAKIWDQYPNAVKVMTAFGSVCHLPHDLRLPFARHVAYTETKWLRRYVIERVFREKQVEGFHPREIVECAFDIVTPKTGSLWSDAETLVVAAKAATEANLRVSITLNHTEILRIVLLCCGVPVDRHKDLYPILVDVRLGRLTNLQLQTHLTSLCITNRDIANLLRLMDSEVSIPEVQDLLGPFTKKAEWSRTLRRAIADLVAVSEIAKGFGLECTVSVAPCLAYNATQHAGVFWQMAVLRENKKHRSGDVIALGGRYDALVEEFWRVARTERDGAENLMSSSVGFSMSLERMANIIRKMDDELKSPAFTEQSTGIAVCISIPPSALESPCTSSTWALAREVWAGVGGGSGRGGAGGVALCEGSVSEARERSAAALVLADDAGAVRLTHWDDNRVREHRIPFIDVVDFLKQKLNPESNKVNDGYSRLVSWSDSEKASGPNISVTFITSNDKMSKNSRRQCENQISTQLSSTLSRLGISSGYSRWRACVVAALCEGAALRALATVLGDRAQVLYELAPIYERFPKRRKILEEIISELQALASNSINQSRASDDPVIFALYSIPDSMLKILI